MTRSPLRWAPPLILFAWFVATAGFRPLTAPDEGRYIVVALDMLHSGDWLVPRLDGLPFFHKPPLFYWLGAIAMQVFGVHAWAARLPSVIGATLAAASLHAFLRRHRGAVIARRSALVLATLPFFYVGAQFANLDMLVAGCISATVLLCAHAALERESGGGLVWTVAAFAMAALGMLAKGLIGIVLPAGIFILWCLVTRRPRQIRLLLSPAGWAVFLLVGMPWFVSMQMRFPMFFDYFVVTQHFRRFAETGFNNARPFWFYLPVIVGLSLPWSVRAAARPRAVKLTDIDWLMLVWALVVLVFFSLPQSKLVGYVLPALPPLAYGIARLLEGRPAHGTAGIAVVVCLACIPLAGHYAASPAAGLHLPEGEEIAAADKVVMLDNYLYELPYYWQLRRPMFVAADWTPALVRAHDNWRKELFDAARFAAPQERARLISPADIPALACTPGATWLVGDLAAAKPLVGSTAPVASNAGISVWRLTPSCTDITKASP